MKKVLIFTLLIALFEATGAARQAGSPSEAVLKFYRGLKNRQYLEGFRHSVYSAAVEGLTPAEMQELEPEFARTFSAIPDRIEAKGEQITGETATVTLQFDGIDEPQVVALVRVGGRWLVGDAEALQIVQAQGRSFFFNARIQVNENEAFLMMARIVGAQVVYSQKFEGRCATLAELLRLGGVPKDLESGETDGYRFTLTLAEDQKSFVALATPIAYGKTGRLSFYADLNGVRAEDLQGRPASAQSPMYPPK